jgi:hypothetical protein
MDKASAIDHFWNGFGIPAYDENTVPDNAPMPRITYNVITDSLGNTVNLSASIWYQGRSWKDVTLKAEEIEKYIGEHGGIVMNLDNGKLWMVKGSPFSQRMSDNDSSIRRIYLNIQAEFLTAY